MFLLMFVWTRGSALGMGSAFGGMGICIQGVCIREIFVQGIEQTPTHMGFYGNTVNKANSTHPTGMYTCCDIVSQPAFKSRKIVKTVCSIMVMPIAHTTHQVWAAYATLIEITLHTIFTMFVNLWTGCETVMRQHRKDIRIPGVDHGYHRSISKSSVMIKNDGFRCGTFGGQNLFWYHVLFFWKIWQKFLRCRSSQTDGPNNIA